MVSFLDVLITLGVLYCIWMTVIHNSYLESVEKTGNELEYVSWSNYPPRVTELKMKLLNTSSTEGMNETLIANLTHPVEILVKCDDILEDMHLMLFTNEFFHNSYMKSSMKGVSSAFYNLSTLWAETSGQVKALQQSVPAADLGILTKDFDVLTLRNTAKQLYLFSLFLGDVADAEWELLEVLHTSPYSWLAKVLFPAEVIDRLIARLYTNYYYILQCLHAINDMVRVYQQLLQRELEHKIKQNDAFIARLMEMGVLSDDYELEYEFDYYDTNEQNEEVEAEEEEEIIALNAM